MAVLRFRQSFHREINPDGLKVFTKKKIMNPLTIMEHSCSNFYEFENIFKEKTFR